jgi:hypothetical protein
MPTSERSQINYFQYPRIPSKILKGALCGRSSVAVKPNNDEVGKIMSRHPGILHNCKGSGRATEACRPQEGLKLKSTQAPEDTW